MGWSGGDWRFWDNRCGLLSSRTSSVFLWCIVWDDWQLIKIKLLCVNHINLHLGHLRLNSLTNTSSNSFNWYHFFINLRLHHYLRKHIINGSFHYLLNYFRLSDNFLWLLHNKFFWWSSYNHFRSRFLRYDNFLFLNWFLNNFS